MEPKASVLIGTSGYDYPEWKGVFYPPEIKRTDFLSYYSTVFNALELNFCFYSMPTAERMKGFIERTESKVQFGVKANRLLTHEIDKNWKSNTQIYIEAIKPMLEKNVLSSILFQFPQSFHYTPENRIYLADLIAAFQGFPIVVEFRHREWLRESVFAGFTKRNVNLAFCDMPNLKALPNMMNNNAVQFLTGPQAYIRMHGRNENAWYCNDKSPKTQTDQNGSARYNYNYSDSELAMFVPVIESMLLLGKKVSVFFNNHPQGNGANNAKTLKALIKN